MLKRYLAIIFLFLSAPSVASAQPLIVAHRGASHDAPENTLPAFLEAWRQRADAIEGDFHLTKDGKIVCIHDKDTQAVAGVKKVIKTSTWQELQELDVGRWHDTKWNGTRIPTIDAVLSTVPRNKRILIEVKCGPEIVPALVRQMKASKLQTEQMLVISFDAEVIYQLKLKSPNTKAFWLSSFKKSNPLNPSLSKVLGTLRASRADGFSSKADGRISAEFVNTVKQAGFEYHTWTIDDAEQARKFVQLGAQSITTNRPGMIRQALGLQNEDPD